MAENQKVNVTLANGISFEAMPDGVGNLIVDSLDESALSVSNLSEVTIESDGRTDIYSRQVLRCYQQVNGGIRIRLSDMTDLERLDADYNAKLDYLAMMTDVDLEVI